jgi:hypothetical protein
MVKNVIIMGAAEMESILIIVCKSHLYFKMKKNYMKIKIQEQNMSNFVSDCKVPPHFYDDKEQKFSSCICVKYGSW